MRRDIGSSYELLRAWLDPRRTRGGQTDNASTREPPVRRANHPYRPALLDGRGRRPRPRLFADSAQRTIRRGMSAAVVMDRRRRVLAVVPRSAAASENDER